jgi:hypothetical protein
MAKRANKATVAPKGASVVDTEKFNYETTKIRGADGKLRHSRGNQDAIAKAMLVFVAAGGDIKKVVKANGLTKKMEGRDGLNAGLYRMNVGVQLRKLVRDGTPVVIGDITVKSLEQYIKVPEAVEKPARKKAA